MAAHRREDEKLFGAKLNEPRYIKERGEIVMDYRTRDGDHAGSFSERARPAADAASARAHGRESRRGAAAGRARRPPGDPAPAADLPGADRSGAETGSQIIAASHSEVILNEAADRDMVIAFVGKPHRIDDRGSQVLKALRDIGFEHYYLAEETGWVLYLEGSTDLAMLRAFASYPQPSCARIPGTALRPLRWQPAAQGAGAFPRLA
jgi:hypothetical protein